MKKRNLVLFGTVATLSLALAGSIGAVTASAADIKQNTETKTVSTTVTYAVEEKWTVTIPDTITIEASGESAGTEQVTIGAGAILGAGKTKLKVTVTGNFKLAAGGKEIEYELVASDDSNFDEAALTSGDEVVSTTGGNEAAVSKYLQAKIKEDATITNAGSYTETLTFSVEQEGA